MEKRKREQRSSGRKRQMVVIWPPDSPLLLQNVADVAEGEHSASAERLDGQQISSSGGNMNKRWSGKYMLTM